MIYRFFKKKPPSPTQGHDANYVWLLFLFKYLNKNVDKNEYIIYHITYIFSDFKYIYDIDTQ